VESPILKESELRSPAVSNDKRRIRDLDEMFEDLK
jgi:hypothetical protein